MEIETIQSDKLINKWQRSKHLTKHRRTTLFRSSNKVIQETMTIMVLASLIPNQGSTRSSPRIGIGRIIDHKSITLQCNQDRFSRTVNRSKVNNIAIFWLVPGFKEFSV